MARFRANPDTATFLLAGAAAKKADVSVVKVVDGYLTAPDDIVEAAYKQGLDKALNIDPDTDVQVTAPDSVAEGRAQSEEFQRVKAAAEKVAADKEAEAQAKADEEAVAAKAKAATTRTRTARKAAAKVTSKQES